MATPARRAPISQRLRSTQSLGPAARWLALAGSVSCAACSSEAASGPATAEPQGTMLRMDFGSEGTFFRFPFPSEARRRADDTIDLTDFSNPHASDLQDRVIALLRRDARGFGTTSAAYFAFTAPIDAQELPTVWDSVEPGSPVALIGVQSDSPDYLKRYPVATALLADTNPYGESTLLAVLPLQGVPLRPKTLYAAVVTRVLHDADGASITPSPAMTSLAGGAAVNGLGEPARQAYDSALAALAQDGIAADDLAGLAVFETDSPAEAFGKVTASMLAAQLPTPSQAFQRNEVFDDYCVYSSTIPVPEYQQGTPPYTSDGGDWAFDDTGAPVLQRMEEANIVVTIPRRTMPGAGYPIVLFSRTGGGGDRPLVDRGVQAVAGGPAIVPGSGPALYFAKAGFAGASVDGPHGGLRNVTHDDEQFLMFNVGNPAALRDNVRQSAAELVLQAHVLETLAIDVTDCDGAEAPGGSARFDTGTMALMGHSMGATITPLTAAYEPRFRALLLSGAGGSWIENVIYKQHPLAVKGIAEVLLGMAGSGYSLTEYDPVLSLFQWAGEPADPPVYTDRIALAPVDGPPRHVLMMQGIIDSYILPSIANATSLSAGLDLAGDELDDKTAGLSEFTPLGELLPLVGRAKVALPVDSNLTSSDGSKVTAVVTQHPEDGIENGHEVVFQTEAPKHEYRCFLEGLASGTPRVPSPGKALDPCD